MKNNHSKLLLLLQISTFCLFAGRAWQHLAKGGPYLTLFTNDLLARPFVEAFSNLSWAEYIRSPEIATWGKSFGYNMGYFFLACAILTLVFRFLPKWINLFWTILATLVLLLLAFALFQKQAFRTAQFFEYSAQVASPILLYYWCYQNINVARFTLFLKIILALTFISHGLYAIGYYPIPGKFIGMTNRGFGVTDDVSKTILLVAGWLDIVVSIGLFLPFRKIQLASIMYMIIWGGMTAFARVWANYYPSLGWYSLQQWIPETMFRVPHFMLGIVLFWLVFKMMDRTKLSAK